MATLTYMFYKKIFAIGIYHLKYYKSVRQNSIQITSLNQL